MSVEHWDEQWIRQQRRLSLINRIAAGIIFVLVSLAIGVILGVQI